MTAIEAARQSLEAECKAASALLRALRTEVGPMGLTPDHIKFSPEYRAAKHLYDQTFAALRRFNTTHKPGR